MDASELLSAASARTGLHDFGPDDFREGFTLLVDAINREAGIRETCQAQLQDKFVNLLIQRLWFARDMQAHAEIARERIRSPLIILSLPRTGSTKLHRMLGATGHFQTLNFWQTMKFARVPGIADGGVAQRIREARAYEAWIYEQSPAMLIGHPLHAEEPEEECFLMEATYRHPTIFGMYDTPSYAAWVAQADLTPAYDYLVSVIKYLQWQNGSPAKPWLFKDPNHMGQEDFLTAAYESPRFIVTHRDPVKCVPSVTSTVMATRRIFSDQDNSHVFADKMLGHLSSAVDRHMAWRARNPDIPVLDLAFAEVVRDGRAVARKVYEFAGLDLTMDALRAIEGWEADNPKGKHGEAKYSAEDVGSTDEEIRRTFSRYYEAFGEYL
ncbi:sulfotransferase family protein [Sphingobium mellinum]|uniref:sulfotransferase family protein n=1 Tax=Sphingobium mellinum TaxID=1387166 RepID=UPI0030EC3130